MSRRKKSGTSGRTGRAKRETATPELERPARKPGEPPVLELNVHALVACRNWLQAKEEMTRNNRKSSSRKQVDGRPKDRMGQSRAVRRLLDGIDAPAAVPAKPPKVAPGADAGTNLYPYARSTNNTAEDLGYGETVTDAMRIGPKLRMISRTSRRTKTGRRVLPNFSTKQK